MNEDAELLGRYTAKRSEAAFAELIRRHVDLVYSAALRLVRGDVHRAQDVTQQVFTELARQAKRLAKHPALAGWLYTTTRRMASHTNRSEQRRKFREQEAHAMNELLAEPASESNWEHLRPVLDDTMHELGEQDRLAVLLRFFQNKSLKEVGAALDLSENAARMRVERALDKLRSQLASKGVTSTAAALALTLTGNAVTAAPSAFVTTLASVSLAGAAAGTGTLTLLKIMTMTKLKAGIISAIVVAGAATPLVIQQHQAQVKLRDENETLRQQIAQLQTDNESLSNRVIPASSSFSNDQLAELLRLRGEVGRLRRDNETLAQTLKNAENKRLKASSGNAELNLIEDPNQWTETGKFLPKEKLSNVGASTPAKAMQTYLWAMAQGDQEKLSEMLSRISTNRAERLLDEFNTSLADAKGISFDGVGTAGTDPSNPTRATVVVTVVQTDNTELSNRIGLRLNGQNWKIISDEWTPSKSMYSAELMSDDPIQ